MDREQQRRRIDRLRYGIIGGAAAGALGIAGALGFVHSSAAASTTGTDASTDSGTTSTSTTSSSDDWGGSTDLSQGSGDSHATTTGS